MRCNSAWHVRVGAVNERKQLVLWISRLFPHPLYIPPPPALGSGRKPEQSVLGSNCGGPSMGFVDTMSVSGWARSANQTDFIPRPLSNWMPLFSQRRAISSLTDVENTRS